MAQSTLSVKGMSCQGCVNSITQAAEGVPGVQLININLADGQVVVTHHDDLDKNQLKTMIEDLGFEVQL